MNDVFNIRLNGRNLQVGDAAPKVIGTVSGIPLKLQQSVQRDELYNDLLEALGADVVGSVDSAKNLILSGNLESGTYHLHHEKSDGSLVKICDYEVM